MRLLRPRLALAAILVGVLALNGVATLYAAATAPTIKACVKSSGAQKGLMRYVPTGSCAAGEVALTWNVTGPAGPTGPAGAGGYTASAPMLYSTGWVHSRPPQEGVITAEWTVASLKLPPGTYDVRSVAWVNGLKRVWFCELLDSTWVGVFGSEKWQYTYSLEDTIELTSGGTVALKCSVSNAAYYDQASTIEASVYAEPVTLIKQ